jgi:short-subunit dehydrogenase
VVIVGATSAIAEQTARCFAADGATLLLVGRSEDRLATMVGDLTVRGAQRVESIVLDVTDIDAQSAMFDNASATLDTIDVVIIAYGTLPDQVGCQLDVKQALREFHINGTSVIALLTVAANILEQQGSGTLAAITSVAGDRGRQSNYLYGAAKGAVSLFLQGLRNRLARQGVNVLTIKPGFVDTPMTAEFKKGILWASPETVGKGIYRAINKKRDIVYLPWFWRWIMLVILSIPERIFKRLSL